MTGGKREGIHDSKKVRENMKHRNKFEILFIAAAVLIIGCNGGDATYTDGSNRIITVEGIKGKLTESGSLDNAEKRFIAFHVHEFSVADWAKILSKAEADVRGTDLSAFSSSYWNENNLTKAEFQAILAESDGCSVTLLQGSASVYTYLMPGCATFDNSRKPDIVIPGVTYGLYFYDQIDKPQDWTLYSSIALSFQTTQLTKYLA